MAPGSTPALTQDVNNDLNSFLKRMLEASGPPHNLSPFNHSQQRLMLESQADKEDAELSAHAEKLSKMMKDHADAEMKMLQPLFDDQTVKVARAQERMDAAEAELPKYSPPPVINPEDAQGLLFGVMAMALIGGIHGRETWMQAAQNFNGTVDGLIKGDHDRAERYNQQWKATYESAMAKYKASQENMKDILYATDVPINQILRQAEVQAKIDGADEKWMLARQGHIDKLRAMVRDYDRMYDTMDYRGAQVQAQVDASLARLASGQRGGMGGGANLDSYGMWALAKITAAGDKSALIAATSRWSNPQRAEIWNQLGKEWYNSGRDPAEFNQAQITQHVERVAQRWSQVRYEAMGRLENSLKGLEKPLEDAVKQAGGSKRPRALNAPINSLISELGTGPEVEHLRYLSTIALTVGREYMTLATMPVSNAQMHWGAQELADKMISRNASLADIRGFYRAVLLEVKVNRGALNEAVEQSIRDVESLGTIVRPQDYGLPARPDLTPEQMEQRYAPQSATAPR